MFKGNSMRTKLVSAAASLALAGVLAVPPMPLSGFGVAPAKAASSGNYIKIGANSIGTTKRIQVGLNKSMVIDLPGDAHDILVANPEVADAITRTSRRIYIFAKEVGETNLFIFDRNGNQLLSLELHIERDVAGLERHIEKYIRGSDVTVEIVNDNIVLTGTVPTPQDSARAVQLAQIFVKGGEATTKPSTSSSGSGSGSTVISFFGTDDRQSQIVNLLQIDGEDQVTLKVTVAEIQRTIVKQLGIDMTGSFDSIGGLATRIITDNPLGLGKAISNSGARVSGSTTNASVDGMLRALNQAGVMRTLAEPSLTAISGESASFKVGGTYNIPDGKSDDGEAATYSFRQEEYGIMLNFRPVVLSPGRISMRIETEVSEPTFEGSHTIGRGLVPAGSSLGLRKREAATTVELPSGGSMVIAGLLKDDVRQVVSGFPGLSKLPVLGTLFRSKDYQRLESELVVIVTPYLVRPVARQALARPDDNFNPAGDGAGFFLGRVNRIYGTAEGKLPNGRYHGNPGFIFE